MKRVPICHKYAARRLFKNIVDSQRCKEPILMNKILLTVVLGAVAATAAAAQTAQQPPQQPAQATPGQPPASPAQPVIKDPAEYNAYVGAVQQKDPTAQISGLEAFMTQYPNSVMKVSALQTLMQDYQQTNNQQK